MGKLFSNGHLNHEPNKRLTKTSSLFGYLRAIIILVSLPSFVFGQKVPEKYALLVGVTGNAKPELNTGLKFPEMDATALGMALRAVDLLLGDQATKPNIEKKLRSFSRRGSNQGVVFVGLCGHGTEFVESKKSYFCP